MLIFESSRFGKTLTLIIGPEAKHFTVHADRLTSMSEYFRVALKGDWQEAKNDTFTMSEENASVFGFFLEWLYDPHLRYNGANDSFRFLVEAYLLGERRGVRAFRNVIISEINKRWPQDVFACLDIYTLVFTETTEDSKLRQLVIDHIVWEGELKDVQARAKQGEVIHPELAMALYTGVLERVRPGFQAPRYDACTSGYQVHDFHCGRKGCGKTPELAHSQDNVAYLAAVYDAPYRNSFCSRYHEHKPGEIKPASFDFGSFGSSSPSCTTRVYL